MSSSASSNMDRMKRAGALDFLENRKVDPANRYELEQARTRLTELSQDQPQSEAGETARLMLDYIDPLVG